ncbi:MAG: alpha-L-fucosidase [Acidobacteria bacterium]|nr:alpha-L-fucosidase [Acidobacteriota bacterium]
MRRVLSVLVGLLVLGGTLPSAAQEGYRPTPENLEARAWFRDARFGLFIHWGVYSVLGRGEWVMQNEKIPIAEYEKLPPRFNPTEFDPTAWVAMAKAAGMRYITITSKHHDGFAMYDSKTSDYDIVDRTPYGKDVLKMLAEECRKEGLKLFFYYSQLDWHHPDYFPRGRTGQWSGRPEAGEWDRYLDYMDAQLTELLTGYGPLGGIWFDGWWDRPEADWRLERTYSLIHELQPGALIGSNHHRKPFPGEDFQMFERDLPGHNTAGWNDQAEIGTLPLEMCETINRSWGYNADDDRHKSLKELVHLLVKAAGYDANLLLNVGPKPDGTIQPQFVERLREVGDWLRRNGESVYGTRGGPIPPRPWGVTTQEGRHVYVHVLDWPDKVLALPRPPRPVRTARYLAGGREVPFSLDEDALLLRLDPKAADPIDTIVVLELADAIMTTPETGPR